MGKFILEVDSTMEALLKSEDLDGDGLITVDDCGPKVKRPCFIGHVDLTNNSISKVFLPQRSQV